MLTFLAGGSASAAINHRLDDGVDALVSDLCWLRRGRPEVREHASHRWEDDPLAGGGYAFLSPAFDPAWLPLLAAPVGRLHFAGEHTSLDFPGYMEGAVRSGLRAAREVLERSL